MSDPIVHYKGARQPPLYATLSTDVTGGDPLPAGATVQFSMRPADGGALKIDHAAAVVTSEPSNTVRYDWAAADVNTEALYAGWWTVTISGQTEDTPEFPIWIRDHVVLTNAYVSEVELRNTMGLDDGDFANLDLVGAIKSASSIVDDLCYGHSPFRQVTETRWFSPVSKGYVIVGPVSAITAVSNVGGAWTEGTHYFVDGGDTLRPLYGYQFWPGIRTLSVTATFGYATVPQPVKDATKIIARQIVTRQREAPMGVLTVGLDGAPVRIGQYDPTVDALLAPYTTSAMIE